MVALLVDGEDPRRCSCLTVVMGFVVEEVGDGFVGESGVVG